MYYLAEAGVVDMGASRSWFAQTLQSITHFPSYSDVLSDYTYYTYLTSVRLISGRFQC